ncbi:lipopolysaccharide transport system ATP-binding protein [Candidatus Termititenax aidoneus]|uniref:Lipopolysaccharide transport system ATP-binding protein n=1 Tax=Termititenax aidoneus TaxID=2218524 RepID=A0A388TBR9_TERA1|nr:lipopolysaccharide transport system ATP-binding protein [Candidatus Termititenax aidoneus]
MSDVVLKVENLYKEYRLGVISHGTLFRDLQSWWARARGQEDPNSLVNSVVERSRNDRSGNEQELKQHFLALNDVSFEVKQGDILGVIGKNGAGKSTLLKVLSRITAPTAGTVKIKGRIASLLEVGTGFHPELTGRENVYMNGAILGMRRWEIGRKMDEIIAFAGLEKFIDTPVKRYSSGMYVRLAFAVAAHLDAEILLMDEVLAVGDAEFQKKALGKMGDVAKSGRTVLFVSHNMGAVKELCACGLVLRNGEICKYSNNINEIVSLYLNNFEKASNATKWVNDGKLCNPYFAPLEMELQEENGCAVTTSISAEKSYRIKLVFEVQEINPQMHFYFTFIDTLYPDTVFFYATPMINSEYKVQLGTNTIFCYLPENLFNTHQYTVFLVSSIKLVKYIVPAGEVLINFKITHMKQKQYSLLTSAMVTVPARWEY